MINNRFTINQTTVNPMDYLGENVLISVSTGKWAGAPAYFSRFIPITNELEITVTANQDNNAVIALLKNNNHTSGDYPDYATGSARTVITAGESLTVEVPDDANYFYFAEELVINYFFRHK